jgi:hypothetical protein
MPRKQRFKPSRKPKPILANDDAMMGSTGNGATTPDERNPVSAAPQVSQVPDVPSTHIPGSDVQSG